MSRTCVSGPRTVTLTWLTGVRARSESLLLFPLRSRQSVSKVRSTKSESDVSHDAAQPVGPVNGGTVTINKRSELN